MIQFNFKFGRGNLIHVKVDGYDMSQELKSKGIVDGYHFLLDNSEESVKRIIDMYPDSRYFVHPDVEFFLKAVRVISDMDIQSHQPDMLDLLPHQLDGVKRVLALKEVILADEMGLGKTITTIGALNVIHRKGKLNTLLVVVPKSLRDKWISDCEKYAHFDIVPIDKVSSAIDLRDKMYENPLATISIDLLKRYAGSLPLTYDVVVVDEVHGAKNYKTQRYRALRDIQSRYKIFLSGTPLVNTPDELYTVSSILSMRLLGRKSDFEDQFYIYKTITLPNGERVRKMETLRNETFLQRIISTYVIRHTWADADFNIPQETFYLPMDLSHSQRKVYDCYVDLAQHRDVDIISLMAFMLETCDSPSILPPKEHKYLKVKYGVRIDPDDMGVKVEFLKRELPRLLREHPKMVMFTKFAKFVKLLYRELKSDFECITITGENVNKTPLIKKFWEDPNLELVITDDALSYGQDLQIATGLVNVELPYSPAVYEQRVGRIRRVGQSHAISVYNLVTNGTIEENIRKLMDDKREYHRLLVEDPKVASEKLFRTLVTVGEPVSNPDLL